MSESLITDLDQFSSFNDFFIRRLRPGVRPLPSDSAAIVCPADGYISELGKIEQGRLLQAKGRYYELNDLFGGNAALAQPFKNGQFFTVYLAPKNYHRVHIPVKGILRQMLHIPGELFSVNNTCVQSIPKLFARNERVICLFETDLGSMAVIFVGALLIGSVVTRWHGPVMPARGQPLAKIYNDPSLIFQAGDELGYFQWGSTVIILFQSDGVSWLSSLHSGDPVLMGQAIANIFNFGAN